MKKKLLLFVFVFSVFFSTFCFANESDSFEALSLYAVVAKASDVEIYKDEYMEYKVQYVEVEILDNRFKGEKYEVIYYLEDGINSRLPLYDMLKVGDRVYAYGLFENGKLEVSAISYYDKTPWVALILVIYAALIVAIGGKKGIKALIGLIFTVLLIFGVLVPSILNGYNSIILTILVCSIVIILTFLIVSGFNKKTGVAIIGTVSGIIAARVNWRFFWKHYETYWY